MKPIDKKLARLADLAQARIEAVVQAPHQNIERPRIERAMFSLDVDQFHIIAKSLQVYLIQLGVDDNPNEDFVGEVKKLVDFFVEGKPL